jgi:hypothetical protein
VVSVFTRSLSDNLASLVKQVDELVGENEEKKMAAFVVLLTDDPDAAEEQLKEFGKKHKIKNVPLTMFDGIAGPPSDKLAKDAEVTVHVYVKKKVTSKHAFAEGKMDKESIDKIMKDSDKILN